MAWEVWKAFEYEVAKSLRTRRNVLSGAWKHVTGADLVHDVLYVECKYRKRIPFGVDIKKQVAVLGEDIWAYHKDTDVESAEKVVLKRKSALEGMFKKVVEMAEKEGKIPVLMVKTRYMQGWVVVSYKKHYKQIKECYE